ncbi:hypothetical protein L1987_61068 [Smallanthus sonchifolius]|uniref:Uncharacterized protein n=1 Tax=Smallanthus sonchifolius TaxID=185202 RepID=A0ACB9DA52_9ASTR|nr:hypothetical protein L1987_61068 [Smallanthus sonchifolius]
MEETLGEKTENVEVRNPVVVEKAVTKKKVRVVKKIVKKKIIKKVPKRASVASNCNDLEKVASPNPNLSSSVEIEKPNCSSSVEIEKPNFSSDPSFVNDDLKEVENVKELEVSDMEQGVHPVGTSDDQIHSELQDSDQNQIELQDGDHNRMELQDGDQNRIELQDGEQNRIELQDGDHNRMELQDNEESRIELLDREHDISTMNVEEHGGEEGVKELIVNSETDGLKSQEALSENYVPSGKMVASGLHMKQMKKIFIHGLGQETKEEDVRKVFEEVGEVVEVKMITNFKTGKNRGFGFISFASVDLANLALSRYQNVEICGRACHTAAIEGIDTILLNNIDKKWNNENVVELLQKVGIKKIDEVLVVPDPDNTELNCGFAFIEFETKKDAQMAYQKLQNENVFGKHSNVKVSWASPSVDPVEEEIHNIKSVYAEFIPLSWDEKEVSDQFKMFGEIESIALAKNLRTTKRNDFAFINYMTCEAALSCIEALTSKKSTNNNGLKGHLKVSLAKSIPKVKPFKTISDSAVTKVSKAYRKPNHSRQSQNQYQQAYQSRQSQQNLSFLGVYKPPQKLNNMIGKHEDSRKDLGSSTTAELVQLLREQASWKHGGPSSTAGMSTVHHQHPSGGKQPFTELGSKSSYHHDAQAYHQSHLQIPNVTNHRPVANMTSFSRDDQQRAHYMSGSFNVVKPDPRYFQIRDQTTYPGSSSIYRLLYACLLCFSNRGSLYMQPQPLWDRSKVCPHLTRPRPYSLSEI